MPIRPLTSGVPCRTSSTAAAAPATASAHHRKCESSHSRTQSTVSDTRLGAPKEGARDTWLRSEHRMTRRHPGRKRASPKLRSVLANTQAPKAPPRRFVIAPRLCHRPEREHLARGSCRSPDNSDQIPATRLSKTCTRAFIDDRPQRAMSFAFHGARLTLARLLRATSGVLFRRPFGDEANRWWLPWRGRGSLRRPSTAAASHPPLSRERARRTWLRNTFHRQGAFALHAPDPRNLGVRNAHAAGSRAPSSRSPRAKLAPGVPPATTGGVRSEQDDAHLLLQSMKARALPRTTITSPPGRFSRTGVGACAREWRAPVTRSAPFCDAGSPTGRSPS